MAKALAMTVIVHCPVDERWSPPGPSGRGVQEAGERNWALRRPARPVRGPDALRAMLPLRSFDRLPASSVLGMSGAARNPHTLAQPI